MNLLGSAAPARDVLGPEMVDSCVIKRLSPSAFDPAIDPQTHRIAPDDDRLQVIYSGPCLVTERVRHHPGPEGGTQVDHQQWNVLIPATGPVLQVRDLMTMIASANPAAIVLGDDAFTITEVRRRTYEVFRSVIVEQAAGASARP